MAKVRIIKKYPNRRLYDTELSRYITVSDLRQLIVDGGDFQVQDANTGEDITRIILLQIINEQETGGEPLFTTDLLMKMIRYYGGSSQRLFTDYMTRSLDLFVQQQKAYQDQFAEFIGNTPMNTMSELARKNMEAWQEVQQNFFKSAGLVTPDQDRDENEK